MEQLADTQARAAVDTDAADARQLQDLLLQLSQAVLSGNEQPCERQGSGQLVTGQLVTGRLVTGQLVTGQMVTGWLLTGQMVRKQLVTGEMVTRR